MFPVLSHVAQAFLCSKSALDVSNYVANLKRFRVCCRGVWLQRLSHLWQLARRRASLLGQSFDVSSVLVCRDDAQKLADKISAERDYEAINKWHEQIKLDCHLHKPN